MKKAVIIILAVLLVFFLISASCTGIIDVISNVPDFSIMTVIDSVIVFSDIPGSRSSEYSNNSSPLRISSNVTHLNLELTFLREVNYRVNFDDEEIVGVPERHYLLTITGKPYGLYELIVQAYDALNAVPRKISTVSLWISIENSNTPPLKAFNPLPVNNATDIPVSTSISWEGYDFDGDNLYYDIWFATQSCDLIRIFDDITATEVSLPVMKNGIVYNWRVDTDDRTSISSRGITAGDVWSFTTVDTVQPTNTQRLMPADLEYLGAFLTPQGISEAQMWEYGGMAMAYYPQGDLHGADDGFPGSLFGAGFDVLHYVSEIDIPIPLISPSKNLADLNTADVIQGFSNLKMALFDGLVEMPRMGMEYLPPQGGQHTEKLYLCWGAHMQDDPGVDKIPSHMWCETVLSSPDSQGAWWVGEYNLYSINDYLFEIPEIWSNNNATGMRLATGRYRDGGWSGFGPTLVAIGPWIDGNPPANGSVLSSVPLIKYSNNYEGEPDPVYQMNGYAHSDEWSGGTWLTAGNKSAVVFVGTKGIGDTWYGNQDGPCLSCDNRGWWSDEFHGQIIFYDTSDLAAVANGVMQPYEPQPYAVLEVDDLLYNVKSIQEWYHLGACSYDRAHGLFYVFEPGRGDGERTLVHVWRVSE